MSIPGSASPLFFQTAAADAAAAGPIKSARFASGDSAYLNRTPSSAGDRKTWTVSFWVKICKTSGYIYLMNCENTDRFYLLYQSGRFTIFNTSGVYLRTDALFRDHSAWYHHVIAFDTTQSTSTDRVHWYINGVETTDWVSGVDTYPSQNDQTEWNTATAHEIGSRNGGSFGGIDYYLTDFYFIDGSQKEATDFGAFDDNGVWQAAAYSGTFGTNGFHLFDFANESGIGNDSSGNDNDFAVNNLVAIAQSVSVSDVTVYRDGAVYTLGNPAHMFDSSKATITYAGSNNATNYIDWSPTGGYETSGHIWIQGGNGSGGGADSMTVTINGSTVTRTAVVDNETYGSPSYGYGDWHKYTVSGNTLNSLRVTGAYALIRQLSTVDDPTHSVLGISDDSDVPIIENVDPAALDILRDVPTNGDSSDDTGAGGEVSGNYCTLNALQYNSGGTVTLSNGNLNLNTGSTTSWNTTGSTIAVSSGKWLCEVTIDTLGTLTSFGVSNPTSVDVDTFMGITADSYTWFAYDGGGIYTNSAYTDQTAPWGSSSGTFPAAGDVVGMALDMDAGTLKYYINGSLVGTAFTGITGTVMFCDGSHSSGSVHTYNFGQRAFAYPVSGYKALCTANLPTPTIADGSDYFDTKIWTGTGSTLSITGYEFSPDFVWIKNRTDTSSHHFYDIVRGVEKRLKSNDTAAEDDYGSSYPGSSLTSFNSDGFTVGDFNGINGSSDAMVGWAWDAGSSTVSNTDGSITSSVRANQTAGFSIVSYTGTGTAGTIGHNLNSAPEFLIIKNRDGAHQWPVYFKVLGAGNKLQLNDTAASASTGHFNSTDPTSSVFSVGTTSSANNNGDDHIAYCFAPVAGYSAFGSLTTNGSADGTFAYTGFKPAFILYRYSNTTGNWAIFDSKRNTYNVMDNYLFANTTAAEASSSNIDFLSNGFKFRISLPSGNTIIYACFAENPFQANGGLAR